MKKMTFFRSAIHALNSTMKSTKSKQLFSCCYEGQLTYLHLQTYSMVTVIRLIEFDRQAFDQQLWLKANPT